MTTAYILWGLRKCSRTSGKIRWWQIKIALDCVFHIHRAATISCYADLTALWFCRTWPLTLNTCISYRQPFTSVWRNHKHTSFSLHLAHHSVSLKTVKMVCKIDAQTRMSPVFNDSKLLKTGNAKIIWYLENFRETKGESELIQNKHSWNFDTDSLWFAKGLTVSRTIHSSVFSYKMILKRHRIWFCQHRKGVSCVVNTTQ
jgi:hypothetical protein